MLESHHEPFKQEKFEIDVYGYTVLNEVLTLDEAKGIKKVLAELDQEIGTDHQHLGTARHVANLPTYDPVFFKTIDHPKVLPLIEHFMGENIILGSLNARIVRPGDTEQHLHGDIPQPLIKKNAEFPVMMNTVWMLDEFTPEIGATRIVPGSHKSGYAQIPKGVEVRNIQTAVAPLGSVLIFNGQCWHGGGANTSNEVRHALFGHYRNGSWMRFQCDPHHRFKTEWLDLLTDRQKQLLRMENGIGVKNAADFYERL